MMKLITKSCLLLAFVSLSIGQLTAQTFVEFCGSTFEILCDGTVNVDLDENVDIYKIWNGGTLIAELNNYDPTKPDVIYTPFNSGGPGNPVPPGENYYLDIQTTECGDTTINISDILRENCNHDCETEFDICGSTFEVLCDGTVNVDLADNVFIYKVWNGGDLIVELNNFRDDLPDVIYTPFNSGTPGNPIPPCENYYLDIQTEDCGVFTLNISAILEQCCTNYQVNCFDSGGDDGNRGGDRRSLIGNTNPKTVLPGTSVYPNPTAGELNLNLPFVEDSYTIVVRDLNGRILGNYISQGGQDGLNLSQLANGLYLLDIQSADYQLTKRIMLNK